MYIHGGYNTAGSFLLNDVDIFDFASRTWSDGASSVYATRGHSAVVMTDPSDGKKKMYVFGGDSATGSFISNLRVYDFATNAWSDKQADIGMGRAYYSAVVMNDPDDGNKEKMYVFGGSTNTVPYTIDVRIYDPSTNSWSAGVSDTGGSARSGHRAVVMTDPSDTKKKMYVFGGGISSGYTNTVRIYSLGPGADTWTSGATDNTGGERGYFSAVVLNNKMYVFGGWNNGNSKLNDVRIYNPVGAGSWSTGVPDTQGGIQAAQNAVAYNGLMWMFAENSVRVYGNADPIANFTTTPASGAAPLQVSFTNTSTDADGTIVSWAWDFNGDNTIDSTVQNPSPYTYTRNGWYDASLTVKDDKGFSHTAMKSGLITAGNLVPPDAWTLGTPSTSGGDANGSFVAMNEKLYYFGGGSSTSAQSILTIYDLVTKTWANGTDDAYQRRNHTAVVMNGKMYVFGGEDGAGTPVGNALRIYNPATGWSNGTIIGAPANSVGHAAAALVDPTDGKIKMYVYKQYRDSPDEARLYIYDPASNTWTRGRDNTLLNSDTYKPSAVVINNKMYIFGGTTYTSGLGNYPSWSLFIYDPATTLWSTGQNSVISRTAHSAVAINGKMYVYGGLINSNFQTTVTMDIYDPATGWTSGVSGAVAVYNHSAAVVDGQMYVHGGGNSSDFRLFQLYGNHTPVADFSATPTSGDPPLNVTFTSASTDDPLDPAGVTTWSWDFDNNGTEDSTVQNPTRQYTLVGSYTILLKVTDAGGKTSTKARTQYVNVGTTPPGAGTGSLPVRLSVIKEVITPADGVITSPGATVSYKITITNWGTADAAQNYKITDILPPGFTFASVTTGPAVTSTSGRKLIWNLAPAANPLLKDGGQLVITYNATAP